MAVPDEFDRGVRGNRGIRGRAASSGAAATRGPRPVAGLVFVTATAGVVLIAAAACAGAGAPSEGEEADVSPSLGPVETEELFREQHTGFEEARRQVVRDADAWRDVWATAHEGRAPVPPVPEVDFSTQSVVLAAMGQRPTGGYEVAIREVARTEEGLVVAVRETSPGEGCMVTQALTAPAVAVRIRVAGAPASSATFEVTEERRDCG